MKELKPPKHKLSRWASRASVLIPLSLSIVHQLPLVVLVILFVKNEINLKIFSAIKMMNVSKGHLKYKIVILDKLFLCLFIICWKDLEHPCLIRDPNKDVFWGGGAVMSLSVVCVHVLQTAVVPAVFIKDKAELPLLKMKQCFRAAALHRGCGCQKIVSCLEL